MVRKLAQEKISESFSPEHRSEQFLSVCCEFLALEAFGDKLKLNKSISVSTKNDLRFEHKIPDLRLFRRNRKKE